MKNHVADLNAATNKLNKNYLLFCMRLNQQIVSNDSEFNSFVEVIKNAGLPYQDLNYQNQVLISYYENDTLIGTGGLEVVNKFGLLRSVSVNREYRNKNIGRQITSDILKNASKVNLEEIYLLTETAKGYFQKLGFKEVKRELVPEEIKSTTEFSSVCPTTAVCMVVKIR